MATVRTHALDGSALLDAPPARKPPLSTAAPGENQGGARAKAAARVNRVRCRPGRVSARAFGSPPGST
jgi:hypothetical protein